MDSRPILVHTFYRLASEDAQLSQLAERYRGLKPPRFPTLFEAVINGIASQQITLTLGIRKVHSLKMEALRRVPLLPFVAGAPCQGWYL